MRSITVDDVMSALPCSEYSRFRVESLWGKKEALTPLEIAELDIPIRDRVWALFILCMDKGGRRLFALEFPEVKFVGYEASRWGRDQDSLFYIEGALKYAGIQVVCGA